MKLFTEQHAAKICGELSCLDRVVVSGTIPGICYAEGMSSYLRIKGIRIFDYARWAEPLRDQIRRNAQALAEQAGPAIEHLRNSNVREGERSLRGFNLFAGDDLDLFQTLLRGEFNISGFQNKHLAQRLQKASPQISWLLKRLRCHGLIKKIGHCYKYYLTALGRRIAATAVRLREMTIIPSLCAAHAHA